MSIDDKTKMSIVQRFLQSKPHYLELGLAVEEAVEALRENAAKRLYEELSPRVAKLHQRHRGSGWLLAETMRSAFQPSFWRRFHRRKDAGWEANQYSGIWVGHWRQERLDLEVCVEGWPADKTNNRKRIANVFDEFTRNTEGPNAWSEDPRNAGNPRRLSYHFNGDRALLLGDLAKNLGRGATQIESLLSQMLDVVNAT